MPGEQENNMREMMLDKILTMQLFSKQDENLTPWGKLQIINETKNSLIDALDAFIPDLPTQFSTQVESITNKMREQFEMLFDEDEFMGFMNVYKIKLDGLNAMMDPGHRESGDLEDEKQKKKQIDEHANIRGKMQNFEANFTKLYEKVKHHGAHNISFHGLKMRTDAFRGQNNQRVEWMNQQHREEPEEE